MIFINPGNSSGVFYFKRSNLNPFIKTILYYAIRKLKKQIILYLGTFLITFLAVYIKNLSSEYYPVTSTFGIEGNKISYKLDKIHYGNEPFKVMILTDLKDLKGKLIWKQDDIINANDMSYDNRTISATLPAYKPLTKVDYQVILSYNNKDYKIPRDDSLISLKFFGEIPTVVKWLHYVLLIEGLFFSIRTGLEIFNENRKSKKFSVTVLSTFIVYGIMINPLKNSYKLGVINKSVPEITSLFDLQAVLFAIIWIAGILIIFNKNYSSAGTIIISILTLLNFIIFPFVL